MNAIADLWREITTPSDASEGAYTRSLIAMAHGLLGGALAGVLPAWLVALVYIICKEIIADVWYNRGSLRDSIHDSGAVLFGIGVASYYGPSVSIAFGLMLGYGVASAVLYRLEG